MAARIILVAEDEASVRVFLVTALERAGYQVLAAVDGSEALAILGDEAIAIDALVSDIDMPGATGLEVVAFAHMIRPDVGLILTSAGRGLWTAEQVPAGVTLLQKPFTLAALIGAIESGLPSQEG